MPTVKVAPIEGNPLCIWDDTILLFYETDMLTVSWLRLQLSDREIRGKLRFYFETSDGEVFCVFNDVDLNTWKMMMNEGKALEKLYYRIL